MNESELNDLIADRIVEVMNSALALDPAVIYALVESRIPCNDALANHPTIQALMNESGNASVGLLGILNGIAGTQIYKGIPGYGLVQVVCKVICPIHQSENTEGLRIGDLCPTGCRTKLITGPIERFEKVKIN